MSKPNKTIKTLTCPRAYVRAWLNLKGIIIGAKGHPEEASIKLTSAFTSMYLDHLEQVRAYNSSAKSKHSNIRAIKKEVLEFALIEFRVEKAAEAIRQINKKLGCKQEDLKYLEQFVKALTGNHDQLDIAVFAHWIWMCKRKLLGLGVTDHIMPIIFGVQGCGKTVAVDRFIFPINSWSLEMKLSDLNDPRHNFALEENFVILFDELQNAVRSDIDTLKNVITAKEIAGRRMKTTIVEKVQQNCSFIGSTNKPVNEQIFDTTGMRRFYQINAQNKCDWDEINSIDYIALWQGVDENKVGGYLKPFKEQLISHQEALRLKDQFELFLEELLANTEPKGQWSSTVTCSKLYKAYNLWAKENGYQPSSESWFGRKMKNAGYGSEKTTLDGKSVRVYRISANSYPFINDCMLLDQR